MKKVLIITYYFPPSGGAGVQRWLKMIKYLPQHGVQPVVLTVDPQYASYPQCDVSLLADVSPQLTVYRTQTREVLKAYQKMSPQHEIPHTGFSNEQNPTFWQKIARFIRGNFFLPDPRRGWNRYAYQKAVQIIEQEGIDTVITTSPPHSTQLIGLQLKKNFKHIYWIADLRDPWSQLFYNQYLYQTRLAKRLNLWYEQQVLLHADRVITVSADCARSFMSPKLPNLQVDILPNGYDAADFVHVKPMDNGGKLVLSYVGVLGAEYGIDSLLEALRKPNLPPHLQLRLVGQVSPIVQEKLQNLPCEVELVPYVSHQKAVEYMCSADVLLLCIPQMPHNKGILTGKLFEYMAAHKPILLIGPPDGDAAKLIQDLGIGLCADYDANAVYACLQVLLNGTFQMPDVGAVSAYSRQQITQQLAHFILNR